MKEATIVALIIIAVITFLVSVCVACWRYSWMRGAYRSIDHESDRRGIIVSV